MRLPTAKIRLIPRLRRVLPYKWVIPTTGVSPLVVMMLGSFFFSSRRRHTRCSRDWSSDVCSSDLAAQEVKEGLGLPEIKAHLLDELARTHILAVLDTLEYVKRGGRIGGARAFLGNKIGRASCRERV